MYLPIIEGLLVALLFGVSDYFAGKSSKAVGQYSTTIYVLLFSTVILLIALLFTGINTMLSAEVIGIAVLFSFIFFMAQLFAFKAFRYGNLSITAPIVGTYPVVTVIGAVFLLGAFLSPQEIVSIALIILGVILVSTKFSDFRTKNKITVAGVGSALISLVFFGIFAIYLGVYAAIIGFTLIIFISRALGAGIGFITGYATKQDLSFPSKKYVYPLAIAGVTDAFAALTFSYGTSVKSANLPIIAALAGIAGGVTVLCAFVLLKERPEKNQWLGIILVMIGVAVLSYFS